MRHSGQSITKWFLNSLQIYFRFAQNGFFSQSKNYFQERKKARILNDRTTVVRLFEMV